MRYLSSLAMVLLTITFASSAVADSSVPTSTDEARAAAGKAQYRAVARTYPLASPSAVLTTTDELRAHSGRVLYYTPSERSGEASRIHTADDVQFAARRARYSRNTNQHVCRSDRSPLTTTDEYRAAAGRAPHRHGAC